MVLERHVELSHMDKIFACSHSFGYVEHHHLLWTKFLDQLFSPSLGVDTGHFIEAPNLSKLNCGISMVSGGINPPPHRK